MATATSTPVDFETLHIASLAAANDSCDEAIQIYPARPKGRSTAFEVGTNLRVVRESWNQVYQATTRARQDQITVCFSLDAEQLGKISGHPFSAGDVLLIPGSSQHKLLIPPTQFVSIQLNPELTGIEAAADLADHQHPLIIPANSETGDLLKVTQHLCEDASKRAQVAGAAMSGDGGENELERVLNRVLSQASRRHETSEAIPESAWANVSNAQDFMRSNLAEKLALNEVSDYASVSQRTLEYYFKRTLKMSPVRFLRVLRLNEARRRLAEAKHTVTYVASDCGFSHMSHFSAGYHAMFGELPSETARGSRG